jgi:hypothetical protein
LQSLLVPAAARKSISRRTRTLHETSLYWRKALPQKIAWQFGVSFGRERLQLFRGRSVPAIRQ